MELESLFMGQASLSNDAIIIEQYHEKLKKEYSFLKHKFQLEQPYSFPEFFKRRPSNFFTIRLSQLAMAYSIHNNLLTPFIEDDTPEVYKIFDSNTSEYSETHHNFGAILRKKRRKHLNFCWILS